jgi:hypothetical protein
MDPYQIHDVYFDFKHSHFIKSLTFKHQNVKDKRIILFMKHLYLKKIVNLFQVSIIVASTIITFFESMKPHLFRGNPNKQSQIISVCLSTYIAIITAIFKFLKIDDRKEEIYKILQIFNEVETTLNQKLKRIKMIQNKCDDEMLFFNKNHVMCMERNIGDLESTSYHEDDISTLYEDSELCRKKKSILQKHYADFEGVFQDYEQEDIENKILNAKKQFHTMFSYNEIIYYKGKIVESMLLDKVHVGNRTILEAPLDEYKNQYNLIKIYKNEKILCDCSNEVIELEHHISRLRNSSKQIFDEDDYLYGTSWCNNLCLYFSSMCHFCLIMNLYLSLAIKRSKFRILKKKYQNEQCQKDDNLRFLCCRCKAFDQFVEWWGVQSTCCCSSPPGDSPDVVYFCCDC